MRAWICACVCACLWRAAPTAAQNIRDVVRQHVDESLAPKSDRVEPEPQPDAPSPQPKKPDKAHAPHPAQQAPRPATTHEPAKRRPAPKDNADTAAGGIVLSTDGPAYTGPSLPQRVFGRQFQIDLKLGGGYRGWVPQQYPTVEVEAGSYYIWTFDVRARILRWLILRRGYYESNALAAPRTDEAAVAAQIGDYIPKAAWLMGVLGFPITDAWEPIIRYESRAFQTRARPSTPVCVVTDAVADDLSKCKLSSAGLTMVSGFETFVAGVRYDRSKEHSSVLATPKDKLPPITFGIGLMSYRKPYQVTVNGNALNQYLFDGRFRGAGIALATEVGGGPERLFLDADVQFGLGEVKLTGDLTLNELAPEDWLIGYVHGNVTLGYYLPITKTAPSLVFVPSATGGGASFFFFKPSGSDDKNMQANTATVNWDFLWSLHASLLLSL